MLVIVKMRILVILQIIALLPHWLVPISGKNGEASKVFSLLSLKQCSDTQHSHPPMFPLWEEDETDKFCLIKQKSSLALIRSHLRYPIQVLLEKVFLGASPFPEFLLQSLPIARAPPQIEVSFSFTNFS